MVHAAPLLLLGVLGCGRDPILDRAEGLKGGPIPGAEGRPDGPSPGRPGEPPPGRPGEPPPGSPAEPMPGVPTEPPPGGGVQPPPGTPIAPRPGGGGPTVKVSGEIVLRDYELGAVRIDIFDGDQRKLDGPRPSVVGVVQLERPGPFEVEVPASAERIWLGAFIDEDLDGRPSPQDPAGWYPGNPVSTAGGARGIVIELVRQPPPPQHGL